MSHVFISYNQEDSDFAAVLMTNVEKASFDTWMDKSRLRPGADWSQEIDRGIRTALAMVVVMSPVAKASEYVTYEWSFAVGAGIPVIPVMYKATALHPRLGRYQYLDFTSTNVRPWDKLIEEIKQISVLNTQPAIPPFIKNAITALDSANPDDRTGAVRALAEAAPSYPEAKKALLSALNHPLRNVRMVAATKLVIIDPDPCNDRLISVLSEETDYLLIIDEKFSPTALPLLFMCLQSDSSRQRGWAARQLGALRDSAAVSHLVAAIQRVDACEFDIQNCIYALRNIDDASVAPALIKLVTPNNPHIMVALLRALVSLKANEAVPKILEVLATWSASEVRSNPILEVAYSLTMFEPCTNIDYGLLGALGSRNPDAQAAAAIALGAMKYKMAIALLRKIEESKELARCFVHFDDENLTDRWNNKQEMYIASIRLGLIVQTVLSALDNA